MALWNYYTPRYVREDPWDLFEPEPFESTLLSSPFGLPRRRALRSTSPGTHRINEVVSDEDKYQVTLHIKNFKSNEICVKVIDNDLVVKAEHEERPDEHGHVYRHFNRRYVLPRNVDLDQVKATMSDDGTLVVCAPKKPLDTENERNIEIKNVPSEASSISQKGEKPAKVKKMNSGIPVSHEK